MKNLKTKNKNKIIKIGNLKLAENKKIKLNDFKFYDIK
jgi:hypothetical protein